ncbi:type I addiction module toxin, SymE family [Pectobacterium carotovorum subsp. carotovorum]|nr:type I addiction module toxin, SymE family [Pectobacterium carotovorum subsp. carotovorum]MCL6348983.1 type I addiction module toxin, SymE family [Pectobacterium carotovorum subsp. carotovorum]MCL6403446.1 type I addiction module toxin, SymE family [Pectobacterium carotovorum subsp. carotovorum]
MPEYHSKGIFVLTRHRQLEVAGFGTDTPVIITVEYGQLLIRVVAE